MCIKSINCDIHNFGGNLMNACWGVCDFSTEHHKSLKACGKIASQFKND